MSERRQRNSQARTGARLIEAELEQAAVAISLLLQDVEQKVKREASANDVDDLLAAFRQRGEISGFLKWGSTLGRQSMDVRVVVRVRVHGGYSEPMIDREDLESLSSAQLHDRAMGSAKAGGDIDWLWHVLGSMPAAEGDIGDLEDSGMDVATTVSAINGYLRADPDLADALRPQYVDYLLDQQ